MWLPKLTSFGIKLPFFVGCHSSATSGFFIERRFLSVTARPAQAGQPLPLVLLLTGASHSCLQSSLLQSHQIFLLDPKLTSFGVKSPFFVGCHSTATSGCVIESLFLSVTTCPAQAGQPLPSVLLETTASHSYLQSSLLQNHQIFLWLPKLTSFGIKLPFFVGCHSSATSGFFIERRFLSVTARPAQAGQPLPLVLLLTGASHSCLQSSLLQSHQIFLLDPKLTSFGVKSPFFVGCHSAATSGFFIERRFLSVTARPAQAGQPLPLVLLLTVVFHSCLQSSLLQSQIIFLSLP